MVYPFFFVLNRDEYHPRWPIIQWVEYAYGVPPGFMTDGRIPGFDGVTR